MHSSVRAGDSGRPGKSSSKTAWLKPAGVRTVPGGQHRPASGTVWGPPASSRGRAGGGSTSSWGLRASGDPRPGDPRLAERGALGRTPQAWGGDAWPSRGSSHNIPGLPGLMGFMASQSAPSEALRLVGLFQEDLAQNDPHWRVCLDGEAQCFQGAKGWVHLTFCHTLVEGAYLEVAIRAPRVPQSG